MKNQLVKESGNLRQEEKLIAMRNNDETLVDWIYIMDGLSRIDEALQYLEDSPLRIKIWIDERKNQGKLYHGKKTIQIDKKTSYAYEGDIDL